MIGCKSMARCFQQTIGLLVMLAFSIRFSVKLRVLTVPVRKSEDSIKIHSCRGFRSLLTFQSHELRACESPSPKKQAPVGLTGGGFVL